jgi:hypothetical protein
MWAQKSAQVSAAIRAQSSWGIQSRAIVSEYAGIISSGTWTWRGSFLELTVATSSVRLLLVRSVS